VTFLVLYKSLLISLEFGLPSTTNFKSIPQFDPPNPQTLTPTTTPNQTTTMHLATLLLPTALLLTSASAIQNIFIGIKQASCGSGSIKGGQYDLWFTDSDVCSDGLVTGYPRFATSLCEQEYTILGHTGITFTGCTQPSMGNLGLPTGVSDGGAPALTCAPVYGQPDISCPNTCGFPEYPYTVSTLMRCS
jgi:hypothetical protein